MSWLIIKFFFLIYILFYTIRIVNHLKFKKLKFLTIFGLKKIYISNIIEIGKLYEYYYCVLYKYTIMKVVTIIIK